MQGRHAVSLVSLFVLLVWAPEASGQAQLAPVADFDGAMYVTAPPGDTSRLFVVEQDGYIRVVRDGAKLATPFLDIDSDVDGGGEEGLLSMAFAPDYATSRKFYVYYTGNDGDNHVVEFERSATDPDRADEGSARQVLELVHTPNSNHNGGQLQFGPDGYLYMGTGDGGSRDDPPNNAQTLEGDDPFDADDDNPLLGKILRLDPDGNPSLVPPDNPYVGMTGRDEIWSHGLRNPWRFSFDRGTGDMWIGDVGQNAQEEIDFASAASGRGKGVNWGWRCWEGTRKNTDVPSCDPPNDVFPVLVQPRPTGFRAIVGGYVIRDPSLGSLNGRYVYGDNSVTALRSFDPADPAGTDAPTGHSVPGLTSFGEDASGRVYAVSFGRVFRFDPVPGGPGGGNGGPGDPGGGAGTDATPPGVTLSRKRRQPILRQRGVILAMTCSEACSASAAGWISLPGAARIFKLRPVRRSLGAGVRARVKLRLRRKAIRPLRRALRRGQRARSKVRVLAVDPAGNRGVVKRRVFAQRP